MEHKYKGLCEEILIEIGGKENILKLTHCATRLRINFKDNSLVNIENIKKIEGVLGCQFVGEQFQIIIGQHVSDVCNQLSMLVGIKKDEVINENIDKIPYKFSLKGIMNGMLSAISGCIIPIFPIFVSAGLIKMLVAILGPNILNLFAIDSDIIRLLTTVGDAGFYFFPIFAAWSAAKRFETSIPVALFLAAILIHPSMTSLVAEGTSFTVYGLPMALVNYANQFLPSIMSVWILSYVYKFVEKYCPTSLKMSLVPLCSILIMLPIVLCVVGPLGTYCGIIIGDVANWLSVTIGPIAIGLIGGLWYFLVALGMDKTLVPIILHSFATLGYDDLFWLSAIVATYALIGVAVAYLIRSKKEDKAVSGSNLITLALGAVSEPTIFGCILRYKKAMAWLFIGGFVGGIAAALLGAKAYAVGAGNILFFTVFAGGDGSSFIPGIIACVIAFSVSLGLGVFFGFTDKPKKENV